MPKHGLQRVILSFNDPYLTHFGGIYLIKQFAQRLGLRRLLKDHVRLVQRNHRYLPQDILEAMIYFILIGLDQISATTTLRANGAFRKITGLSRCPHSTTIRRFLHRLDQVHIKGIKSSLYKMRDLLHRSHPFPKSLIFDLDSTVLVVYGKLEGAGEGYQPYKRGWLAYSPLLAFEAHSQDFWHGIFQGGQAHTSSLTLSFLKNLLVQIPRGNFSIRIRGDSGFYNWPFLNQLEQSRIGFAIVAKVTRPIQNRLPKLRYQKVRKGIWTASFRYQPHGWRRSHRFIAVHKLLPDDSKAPTLFHLDRYAYHVIVTNLNLTPSRLWYFYNKRAAVENLIKELKSDYALTHIPTGRFRSNEAYFWILLLAYTLVNGFKRFCLPDTMKRDTLKSIRRKLLVVPARLIQHGKKNILRLPLSDTHQVIFAHVEKRLAQLNRIFKERHSTYTDKQKRG